MSAESNQVMNVLPFHTESPPTPAEIKSTGAFRALRESKGYSVEDVATRLKFTVRQIQFLESEDFDKLPRGIALKGMVKNYAKLLDTEPGPILDALQPLIGNVSGGISQHASTRSLGTHETHHPGHGTTLWVILILVVLLVAGSVAVWQGIVPQNWLPAWVGAMFK